MNDIRPFRGLRFEEKVAGPLSELLCPPYDVISPHDQQGLHARSPHNVVRLELGLDRPEDDDGANRYSRAAAVLDQWLAEGVLRPESSPALYIYEQRFPFQGRAVSRMGVLARLRLTPWDAGVVLPHEATLAKPKEDRLKLMRATACNLSPVYLLFEDPSRSASSLMAEVANRLPDAQAETESGHIHRLWVLVGTPMERLVESLRTPQLYMADGHHRYETALAYRDESASSGAADPEAPSQFVMALLVDAADPGLVVLPTHRLVHGVEAARLAGLLESAREHFEVAQVATHGLDPATIAEVLLREIALDSSEQHAVGLYLPRSEAYVLRLKEDGNGLSARGRPTLDVDLLHDLILESRLGIGPAELRAGGMVTYTRDAVEAVAAVDGGNAQAAFFLNPTRVEQVLETARAGGRMPQKSTYFYPKPETGLVINPLR